MNDNIRYGFVMLCLGGVLVLLGLNGDGSGADTIREVGYLFGIIGLLSCAWGLVKGSD